MHSFQYKTEQFLPIDITTAWDFFSSAKNLAVITPPEMHFTIITSLDGREIYEGMRIDYRVKPLFGISLHWQTEISAVNKPLFFMDRQLKGPYRAWEHLHTFIEKDKGVLMKDEVNYQLPLGLLGKIAHWAIVKKKIENIFLYRREILTRMFTDDALVKRSTQMVTPVF